MCQAQRYGARCNIAGLVSGNLNLEASLAITDKLTLHLPLSWNPFAPAENYKFKHIFIQPGTRWWLWHSYTELFIGFHGITGIYNIALKRSRYEGWGAGAGISCGYAWLLTPKWNIEAELGAGCLYSEYDKYQRIKCGEYEGNFKGFIYGPSRISVSLMFIF